MDAFDRLAERLVRGAQEEYVRDLTERLASMLVRGVDNPDGLALLPRVSREAAMGVWAEHEKSVTGSVREAFEEALAQASSEDAEAVARQAGADEPPALTEWAEERVEQAARATAESVRRQNLALAQTEADEFYATVADASARLNLGEGRYSVIERAIARLAKAGVETVDYLTGRRTTVDAAVRRIVVTQQNRCRNELLQRRCEEFGHDLVLVSAHYGCRPTHEWFQGKVFSRSGGSGETTASGGVRTTYRPLSDTGYPGDPAGLCGANCRHTMTPFVEGFTRLPDTEFESQQKHFGMTSAEYYAATQRQRALERRVRAAKREVAVGQAQGLDMVDSRLRLGRAQAELRAWCAANRLTRDPSRERAYGVAEQPRALRSRNAKRAKTIGDPVDWPEELPKQDDKTRSTLVLYGRTVGVKVEPPKQEGYDPEAVRSIIDSAAKARSIFPEVVFSDKKPLTISFSYLGKFDYAITYPSRPSAIIINTGIIRNLAFSVDEFNESHRKRLFSGSGMETVVLHEFGHLLVDRSSASLPAIVSTVFGIECHEENVVKSGRIVGRKTVISNEDHEELTTWCKDCLGSEYAATSLFDEHHPEKGFCFDELAAECVSSYCSGNPDEKARMLVDLLRGAVPR